ncbi:transketolase C-terminal domain-containing protein [Actinoplanes xinjiangensis]|jgi:2-oxoisovalerate dehydrogenase E1 component|uniref:3-methyl-2-oxobutanoate dehydrogenase (2-methylpropanoyl-transferring) n=1 Tax=Actinoplanes xinjiangensis TaxID=512350 RepID=A0A316FPD5_9ACTN|nr:transketolase C-terminal domain-containing protein [Actinoplanes xinjiangensis]PWK49546.1 2-oxoisovalerate dehydrogenase E1 component [Actinoplanes xinjiangensis]GIF37550.1 MFS transporter [Actinoplanes xinjiangensis]
MLNRVTTPQSLDERFRDAVSALRPPESGRAPGDPVRDGAGLTGATARELFDAQLTSRHLDLAARWLRSFNEGFHTGGSSGHEGNAAVAAALRGDDPALLHHRSAAFYCVRAANHPGAAGQDPGRRLEEAARDVLRGVVASVRDPITGGRDKLFGNPALHLVPALSSPGGHLPRAVGLAHALGRAGDTPWPGDAIVAASFGDGGAGSAGATSALHAAGRLELAGQRVPLLLICEDNTPGEPGPDGWTGASLRGRPGVRYTYADGCDLAAVYDAAAEAAAFVRTERRPAVLHLSTVLLLGRPGDPEPGDGLDRDPLIGTARLLVEAGLYGPDEVITRYDEIGWQVRKAAEEVLGEPKLASAAEVVAPLAARRPLRVAHAVAETAGRALGDGAPTRLRVFDGRLPEDAGPMTLAQTLTAALNDALAANPGLLVFGPATTRGGRHGVTTGLSGHDPERVFDSPPDPTTILGLAAGAGLAGLIPVPEVDSLAGLHGAAEQLRAEAATMAYLSAGAYRNPLVLRVPAFAQPYGIGGHLANDNTVAALRDVPGLVVAVPARAADAAPMLRSCLAAAEADGTVSVFLEPIAVYQTRDLYQQGDNEWLAPYSPPGAWADEHVPIGRARIYGLGTAQDLTIVTYGNGVRMALRVAAQLAADGYGSRIVDLRWLNPLPVADLVREATVTGRVLIVDETRRSGGVGEGVLAALVDGSFVGSVRRVAAADVPVPLGPAAQQVLVGEDAITQGAHALLAR